MKMPNGAQNPFAEEHNTMNRPRTKLESQRQDYTVPQAARIFNCSPNTVKEWIARGKIKAYRLGGDGQRRVPWAEVDRVKSEWMCSPDTTAAL